MSYRSLKLATHRHALWSSPDRLSDKIAIIGLRGRIPCHHQRIGLDHGNDGASNMGPSLEPVGLLHCLDYVAMSLNSDCPSEI